MAIMINDSSLYAAAVAGRALSLTIRAEALADQIDALHRNIRGARDEPVRRAGLRCDTASGWMKQASTELQDAAGHVCRIAAAIKHSACAIPWGACPGHGNTLTSAGGHTWCRVIGCGQQWDHDRAGLPCIEPAQWTVTGKYGRACVCVTVTLSTPVSAPKAREPGLEGSSRN
ncbi:MAG TPA: hypothetical protein VEH31_15570 [Streptosporangiaceae bacterium]|nr:hypothetical protein [Streptosporangiaceae bacterium]